MAKTTIEAEVKLDDKGNLKRTEAAAKKTSGALDQVATSSRNTDRNIKGVAAASSSATKNFSKMAQGMGGVVVPAYAAFAAQMFALSAGFEFLKRAGDLKMLQAGQVGYASATGVAMRTLAKDIQDATNSQINFRDASQAAAIGIAAGLSPEQLTRLGKAAAGVSIALGRDVTDSFNRLVRGVTKAEPELLDELGIILRLDKANRDYADALGLNADKLNAFQRSQAVTNNVLAQAEEKYGRIAEAIGGDTANEFTQLGVVLSEMADQIALTLLPAAEAIAKTFRDIPALALGSFGLLLSGPLAAVGFSLKDISSSAKDANVNLSAQYDKMKVNSLNVTDQIRKQKKEVQALTRTILGSPEYTGKSKLLESIAQSGEVTKFQQAGLRTALTSAETQLKTHAGVQRGIFANMSENVVNTYRGMINRLNLLEQQKLQQTKVTVSRLELLWTGFQAKVTGAVAAIGTAFSGLLRFGGYAALVYTFYEVIRAYIFPKEEISKREAADNKMKERIIDLNNQYSKSLDIQEKILAGKYNELDLVNIELQLAKQIANYDAQEIAAIIEKSKAYREAAKNRALFEKESFYGMDNMGLGTGLTALAGAGIFGTGAMVAGAANPFGGTFLALGAVAGAVSHLVQRYMILNHETMELTDEGKAASETLERLDAQFNSILKTYGSANQKPIASIIEFFDELKNPETTEETRREIQKRLQMTIQTFEGAARAAKEGKRSIQSFYNSVFKPTQFETFYNNIKMASQGILSKVSDRMGVTDGQAYVPTVQGGRLVDEQALESEKDAYNELATIGEKIRDFALAEKEHKERIKEIEHESHEIQSLTLQTDKELQRRRIDALKLDEKKAYLESEVKRITGLSADFAKSMGFDKQKMIDYLNAEVIRLGEIKEINGEITEELRKQKAEKDFIMDAQRDIEIAQAAERLLDVTKKQATEEGKLARSRQKAIMRDIEKQGRDEADKNPFAFLDAEEKSLKRRISAQKVFNEAEAKRAKDNLETEIQVIKSRAEVQKIQMQILAKELQINRETTGYYSGAQDTLVQDLIGNIDELTKDGGALDRLRDKSIEVAQDATQQGILDAENQVDLLEDALKKLGVTKKYADGIALSINDSLTNALEGFIMGTTNAKDAFKSFASSVIADMARIASQQAASAILGSVMKMFTMGAGGGAGAGGGSIVEGSDSFIDIFSDDMYRTGGYTRKGYSTGGVARGPDSGYTAVLHGNEAVVPLPDGRRIPVQLQGGGGVNNITVNVSSDGQTQTQGSSSAQAAGLGRAIALAVQKEIQQQKRSGGMLSPYGAA